VRLYRDGGGVWRSPLLDELYDFEHGFGTALAQPPGPWRTLEQRHTSIVREAADWAPGQVGDALMTSRAGEWVAVKTADCIPLLLADPARRVAAAVHAGWRGVVGNIAGAAVQALRASYGCDPQDLRAALGPSIRRCCFEVGPEVAERFKAVFPERTDLDGRCHVDLAEGVRRQLLQAGLEERRIATEAPCTRCGGEEFHSWRRDRRSGARMYSAIRLRQGG
jgi:YfiH family protein